MRGFLAGLVIGALATIVGVHYLQGYIAGSNFANDNEAASVGGGGADSENCASGETMRAAFDIGSSGPTVRIACVKTATGMFNTDYIVKEKGEAEFKRDFAEYLETAPFDCSDDIFNAENDTSDPNGEIVFKSFKGLQVFASKFSPVETRAAATAAFRNSPSGTAFVNKLNECFPGISARLVSQQLEGELEYRAVADSLKLPAGDSSKVPLVWGIGSTSVQFTFFDGSVPGKVQKFIVFNGGEGSTPFRDIIERDRVTPGSMYNISRKEWGDHSRSRKDAVEKLIPSYLDEKISKATVYGIGGVHKYLVVPNGDPKTYTAKEVKASLNKLIGKTKSELEVLVPTIDPKARVFDTTVSNLILVDGLFTGLGVSEVEVAKVDLADGVLVYEDW